MKRKFLIWGFILLGCLILGQGALAESEMCPFDHEMSLGSESTAVKELQQFLSLDKNVYSGPFTGYYGPLTQKAIMVFQEKAGLLTNGKIDLATATVLCQIYISYKSSEPINSDNSLEADRGCFLSTLNLEIGTYKNANEEVLKLQKWLANSGFYPEKIFTGFFGPLTKKAVQRYQKSQGILQTGIVGVKTTAAICGNDGIGQDAEIAGAGTDMDLTISGIKIDPEQIGVGTSVNVLVQEKNISNVVAGKHITSFYINDKEVVTANVKALGSGGENLSINYDWKCEAKGIYIFKIFVDSRNELIETNKFNNVVVFSVNCGGVTKDLRYSCSTDTKKCEVDPSGSMTSEECTKNCKIGDTSLSDLVVDSFTPSQIKIDETLPLVIIEKNDGNSTADRHQYDFTVAFGGKENTKSGIFNEIEAKATQEAKGSWTCTVAGIYTITINLDPNNDILESNEANNKKIFKIECSDKEGNVPKDDPAEEKKEEDGDEQGDGGAQEGADLPDLFLKMEPATMKAGANIVKFQIGNSGSKDVTTPFYYLLEEIDAAGKVVKSQQSKPEPELKAGLESDWINPFGDKDVICDLKSPFKLRMTIVSSKVIGEKSETNNVGESVCGEVKSNGNAGSGAPGDKTKTPLPPCYSDSKGAVLKFTNVSVDTYKEEGADTAVKFIKYTLEGINAEKASNIKVKLMSTTVLETQSIDSILGCNAKAGFPDSRGGYFVYTCKTSGNVTLKVQADYYGVTSKTISKEVTFNCSVTKDSDVPYCMVNKSINSDGTIKVQPGESIEFRVAGVPANTATVWSGMTFIKTLYEKAYISFSTAGTQSVSGVIAQIGTNKFPCPNFKAIITSSSSGATKKPNLTGYCSINPGSITMTASSSKASTVCFTPYVLDANSKCDAEKISYTWNVKINGKDVSGYTNLARTNTNKTFCLTYEVIQSYMKSSTAAGTIANGNYTIVAGVEAYCNYDDGAGSEKYFLNQSCNGTVTYGTTSGGSDPGGSSSGSLTVSCSASPTSPKAGESVSFSSSVKTSGFASGKCTSRTYSWSGCSSTTSNCSKTYGSTETGAKTITVTAKCSDDSTKTASSTCNINVVSNSDAPTPPTGSCVCNATKCSFGTSGSYLGYTCEWVMNNTPLSSTSSRCIDMQKGGATITQASVKVIKDSDKSVVFNGSCTTGQ